MKGWGAGTMQEIKDKREEKLKLLDQQFTRDENSLSRQVAREELAQRATQSAAQIASHEKLTGATLNMQKTIAEGQQSTQRAIAELGEGGANARLKETIKANADLATKAQDHATRMGAKLTPYENPDDPKGAPLYRMTSPDGTEVYDMPVDKKTGKQMTVVPTAEDTPDIKTIKGLMIMSGGKMSFEDASDLVLKSKDAPNAQSAVLRIFEATERSASTMKNLTEEDHKANFDFAKTAAEGLGYDTSDLKQPSPTSSTEKQQDLSFPKGTTAEEGIAWAKEQLANGKSRLAIRETLKFNKIDPTLVPGL